MRSTHSLASQAICVVSATADTAWAAYNWPRWGPMPVRRTRRRAAAYRPHTTRSIARSRRVARPASRKSRGSCAPIRRSFHAASAIAGSSAIPTESSRGHPRALEASAATTTLAATNASAACGASTRSRCRFSSNAPPASHHAAPQSSSSGTKPRSDCRKLVAGAVGDGGGGDSRHGHQHRADEKGVGKQRVVGARRTRPEEDCARTELHQQSKGAHQRRALPYAEPERARGRDRPQRGGDAIVESQRDGDRCEDRCQRDGMRARAAPSPPRRAHARTGTTEHRRSQAPAALQAAPYSTSCTSAAWSPKPISGTPKTSRPSTGARASKRPRCAYRIAIAT